jgi:hypothetical protein
MITDFQQQFCGPEPSRQEAINMAIWDLRPKTDVVTGVAVGVGVMAAPVVVPLVWSVVRPVLKAVFKSGFMLYETGRGMLGAGAEASVEKPKKTAASKTRNVGEQAKPKVEKKPVSGRKTGAVKAKQPAAAGATKDKGKPAAEKPKNEREKETKETEREQN